MPAITPQFMLDLESRMRVIINDGYSRLLDNLWWDTIAVKRTTEAAREVLVWLLSTAQIRDEGPKGGNIHFDDLVTAQTTLEHRFSGAGLKLLRQTLEDTDGGGVNLAATWSRDIAAQMQYWPQKGVANFVKNAHTASFATAYDGKAFFATDHPVNPYRPTVTYANLLTGAVNGAYPGALPIDESVPFETAFANLQKAFAYIAGIKSANGEDPRGLRPVALLVPPRLKLRADILTGARYLPFATAGGGAAPADVEGLVRGLGYARVIQADELAGFENDTTYFIVTNENANPDLGGIVYIEREAYSINFYGPQTDAELSRATEFEWHCRGRNAVQAGHPYALIKVKAT